MRDIARDASVTLALVNYHGTSKEQLLRQIVARRSEELINARLEALNNISQDVSVEQQVREIMMALLAPMYAKIEKDADIWLPYLHLLAWLSFDDRWQPMAQQYHIKPVLIPFISALQKAVGSESDKEATWAILHLVAGFNWALISYWRHQLASASIVDSKIDYTQELESIVSFCFAGFMDAVRSTRNAEVCV